MSVTLFLSGDVMTGRGIDQILPHPSPPRLFEAHVRSALEYVTLAEESSGPIARPVPFDYVWGDALRELERMRPMARIVNLETAVTTSEDAWPSKGIHYRMHPENVPCLAAAGLDCCVLANNHVLDWGRAGLAETLTTLSSAGIRTAGAGRDAAEAAMPAIVQTMTTCRVMVFAFGLASSGVPVEWRATRERCGVSMLGGLSDRGVDEIARAIGAWKRPGDIAVVSLHWGPNWGFSIDPEERTFAHALLDRAGADVVHGHSSHHVKGIEVHSGKLILYGCGDLLSDYEGIGGHEAYRGELSLLYFPSIDPKDGRLIDLSMVPMRMQRLQLRRAGKADAEWLRAALDRHGHALGTSVAERSDGTLALLWS